MCKQYCSFEFLFFHAQGDHLLIEGNPCTKFGIDQVKGSKDIERTTLGLQTDRPTDSCKTICPLFQGGHKNRRKNVKKQGKNRRKAKERRETVT